MQAGADERERRVDMALASRDNQRNSVDLSEDSYLLSVNSDDSSESAPEVPEPPAPTVNRRPSKRPRPLDAQLSPSISISGSSASISSAPLSSAPPRSPLKPVQATSDPIVSELSSPYVLRSRRLQSQMGKRNCLDVLKFHPTLMAKVRHHREGQWVEVIFKNPELTPQEVARFPDEDFRMAFNRTDRLALAERFSPLPLPHSLSFSLQHCIYIVQERKGCVLQNVRPNSRGFCLGVRLFHILLFPCAR